MIGVAHVGSVQPAFFDDRDLRLFELMADRLALALAQLELFEAERTARQDSERAHRRLSFLAEASTILASSLDYETTLRAVAGSSFRTLRTGARFMSSGPRASSSESRSPTERSRSRSSPGSTWRSCAASGATRSAPGRSCAAGVAELVPEVSAEVLQRCYAGDPAAADDLERLGSFSYMCVPMHGHDHVLGTVTLATGDTERRFDEADLELAEELARRTAIALDNARLFREADERGRASRALDSVADGVFLVDAQGSIRLWNPAAEAITGLRAADVLNLPAVEAIPGWSTISSRVEVDVDLGTAAGQAETVPVEIQGRELWLSISGVGFADGTVYAFRDLTQERALDELKGDFVSTVSTSSARPWRRSTAPR